jgi:hypothetical protein
MKLSEVIKLNEAHADDPLVGPTCAELLAEAYARMSAMSAATMAELRTLPETIRAYNFPLVSATQIAFQQSEPLRALLNL